MRKATLLLLFAFVFLGFFAPAAEAAPPNCSNPYDCAATAFLGTVSVRASGGASCQISTDWPYISPGGYYRKFVTWGYVGDFVNIVGVANTHLDAPGGADDAYAYIDAWDWSGTFRGTVSRQTGGSPPDQWLYTGLFGFGSPAPGNYWKFVLRGVGKDWWGSQTTCTVQKEFRVYYGFSDGSPPLGNYLIQNPFLGYYFEYLGSEGFKKEVDRTYSEVKREDTLPYYVHVLSDRRDSEDEMFTHALGGFTYTPTNRPFGVNARWQAAGQGKGQGAFPVFVTDSASTRADAPGSIYLYYDSRDPDLGQSPRYFLRYKDASGTLRMNVEYVGAVWTEYCFAISYAGPPTNLLTLQLRTPPSLPNLSCNGGTQLVSGTYTIGTNPSDGFTLRKIGVSSDGFSGSAASPVDAWTDNIFFYF